MQLPQIITPGFFRPAGTYFEPTRPVTAELVAHFERERGLTLPPTYLALLKLQNGGRVRRDRFIDGFGTEYDLAYLGGIGPAQHGTLDVSIPVALQDESGRDISRELVLINQVCTFVALDYRKCGPRGRPSVLAIDMTEAPILNHQIAEDFDHLLEGLSRSEREFYFGFPDTGKDPLSLVRILEQCVRAKATLLDRLGVPTYSLRSKRWKIDQNIEIVPNVDAATDYIDGKFWSRPDGLYFPEFPEIDWMARCSIPENSARKLLWSAQKKWRHRIVVMHAPEPQLTYRFVTLSGSANPLPVTSRVIRFGDFVVELPPDFGRWNSATVGDEANGPREVTYTVGGEWMVLQIERSVLTVAGRSFGEVAPGDHIIPVNSETVLVNGVKRVPKA